MPQRNVLQPAYLLSTRPYRETSALIEVLTDTQGRVGLVARGVRGPRARLAGVLQPFTPLLLAWTQAGELGTLTAAEAQAAPPALAGERVLYGWYLNELLLRLLQRHDAHPGLFGAYAQALAALAGETFSAQAGLRVFELRLLAEIGYGLTLPDELDAQAHYRVDAEQGCRMQMPADAHTFSGDSLIALRDETFTHPQQLADARRLLTRALAPHLGGQPLRSRELLRQLRQTGVVAASD